MGRMKEFKDFVARGNVVDMAVGIIIGAAFGAVVKSLVDDLLMPPLGLLLQGVDFSNLFLLLREGTVPGPYPTVAAAKAAGGVIVTYGLFIQTLISFLIIAFAVFLLVKGVNRLKRSQEAPAAEAAPDTRDCPYCAMAIPLPARRCPHCTSELA